ncbi:MAG TPA: PRC-barrel domain-containing protein [Salinivirga sp.]|uniref:PRC-barrel domain-containing protein n=1 Tax=Salinivirga sp. TaxID=1970192 RepID=UPI002B46ABDC|nr:PRC-barrel domain-containing protein [Salinivirga sp.]HKK58697.1 PRC-barrel domain-containing protein [Salinivirga sp.]
MKRSLKALLGFDLATTDKEKGKVKDFLFDEERWVIRYLEADQGKILPSKQVLIPRVFLDQPEWSKGKFPVKMSKEDIEKCPATDETLPVSRKYEQELAEHLQLNNYWAVAPPIIGTSAYPPRPIVTPENQVKEEDVDTNLRSFKEVIGYEVDTSDGSYGELTDIIIDDDDWQIVYFVTNSKYTDTEREVMLAIGWIKEISYVNQRITLEIDFKNMVHAPEYHPATPVNIEFEKKVYDFYGRNQMNWNIP